MTVHLPSTTNGTRQQLGRRNYSEKPVMELMINGFFTVDQQWKVLYWNKAAEKILGVSANDILGRNLWEKFAGTIPVEFYRVYYKAFLQDIPIHFEEYWGELGAWFDVVTYHFNNTLSVSFKSSNQPQAEKPIQQFKTLTELYQLVTEITNDCLWEWDFLNKEIYWIDGGHKRAFGYQVTNSLIPQHFWENCLHPEDKERVLTRLDTLKAEGTADRWEEEYRFKKANGKYAFVHDRGHIIYDEDRVASRMIGATQDISERVLLQNKLVQERQAKQREITQAILTAQENERAEIGKELHDNLNQTLAVAKMYVQMAQTEGKNSKVYLNKSSEFIMKVITEIRQISRNLPIPGGHFIGLIENIKNLLHDVMQVRTVKIEFHHTGIDEGDLGEKFQLTIYRIVQEQLNNILKHANATRASITLKREENEIILVISDNGEGADMLKANSAGAMSGVGIINIKSRADLYNGNVTIKSAPGKGYELKVVLPLDKRE